MYLKEMSTALISCFMERNRVPCSCMLFMSKAPGKLMQSKKISSIDHRRHEPVIYRPHAARDSIVPSPKY